MCIAPGRTGFGAAAHPDMTWLVLVCTGMYKTSAVFSVMHRHVQNQYSSMFCFHCSIYVWFHAQLRMSSRQFMIYQAHQVLNITHCVGTEGAPALSVYLVIHSRGKSSKVKARLIRNECLCKHRMVSRAMTFANLFGLGRLRRGTRGQQSA